MPGRSDIHLTCDDDRIAPDPLRLGRLLRNLMGSATRYSPEGEPIELRGSAVDRETYRIAVTDRGPGIPVELRESFMRPYARGTDTAEQRGSGLGLHIARRLAEAHGGRLMIFDRPG